jgi:hypothetical protein
MKIQKFNEVYSSPEDELKSRFCDIMDMELVIRNVQYSDDYEISYESKEKTAEGIIKYLKTQGLIIALDAKKYNL